MAEPDDLVAQRVAQRLEIVNQEVAHLVQSRTAVLGQTKGANGDPSADLKALLGVIQVTLDAHERILTETVEITKMLAAEIDRLRSHDPPS